MASDLFGMPFTIEARGYTYFWAYTWAVVTYVTRFGSLGLRYDGASEAQRAHADRHRDQ